MTLLKQMDKCLAYTQHPRRENVELNPLQKRSIFKINPLKAYQENFRLKCMATCAKMVCKNQDQGKGEDSSPGSRSWSADLPHTLCTVIVMPLYISSREMLHVSCVSASGFPQKGSSLPPLPGCALNSEEGAKSRADLCHTALLLQLVSKGRLCKAFL